MRKDVQDEAEALLSCADNGLAALKTSIIAAVAAAIAAPLAAAAIAAAHAVPALAAGALAALSSGLMSQSPKRALPTTEAAGGAGAGAFDSYFDAAANPRLQPALQRFLGLREEGEACFGVGGRCAGKPCRGRVKGTSPLHVELRTLSMRVWLSQLLGGRWRGTVAQVRAACNRETRRRRRPDDDGDRRVRQRRGSTVQQHRHRAGEANRRGRARAIPPAYNAARNAAELCAHDEHAHEHAEAVDVGRLGACALCGDTEPCEDPEDASHKLNRYMYMCTFCGALLFPGEATRGKARGRKVLDQVAWCYLLQQGRRRPAAHRARREGRGALADPQSAKLLKSHGRKLNNGLALASAKVKEPANLPGESSWRPSVVIQGKLYHRVGPLAVSEGATPHAVVCP